jgi:hypothetical protein
MCSSVTEMQLHPPRVLLLPDHCTNLTATPVTIQREGRHHGQGPCHESEPTERPATSSGQRRAMGAQQGPTQPPPPTPGLLQRALLATSRPTLAPTYPKRNLNWEHPLVAINCQPSRKYRGRGRQGRGEWNGRERGHALSGRVRGPSPRRDRDQRGRARSPDPRDRRPDHLDRSQRGRTLGPDPRDRLPDLCDEGQRWRAQWWTLSQTIVLLLGR